ncbi:hypothetical protein B4U45_16740 [Mycobacterium persicum]|uniref:Uncharacterized protein n=1 Tax=Mycobacterium persicum TaxID=1487726 RepID=A0A8E2IRT3_9MYCO|nr:hypothetical protein [Mycobacterium persicum]KZS84789.1 hypothetical protein A4G31_15600 [Mycobacterium persicum]ORB95984.1 hypothetical protein B1T44_17415 [Mycobacterium persicum]ORC08002.1 hypothetical protein B4U45_16740 [Mycobacterium persicum]VAZ71061.1 hypothetical protein LAUMK15_00637 [Mycobacterium persicum]VAZ87175.1 hypothetical protein LAUMK4_00284 [Mycobacterium persicum]
MTTNPLIPRPFRIWGGDGLGGTQTHGDVLVNQLADGVTLDSVWLELGEVLALYNSHRSALANLLSYRTINAADAVPQNVKAEHFEEATEFGVPSGVSDPSYLKLGYSWRDYDLALRCTWKYLRSATSEQVTNRITRALEADNRLVTGSILQRLFSPIVFTNDFGHNCYGLWNADGMKPPNHMGRTFDGTHTHYLATNSTTLDPIHVENGIRHIAEHGYGTTQAARFLLLAHPNDIEASEIASWRAGVTYDTNKTPRYDFIPSSNAPAYISQENIHGAVPPAEYEGLLVTGSYGKAWIIESYFIPQGYVAIVATGGPGSDANPVGFREHTNPAYRGLRRIPGQWRGYPLQDSFLARGFGTGVRHRGAAVAIQIAASPTYAPPVIEL